MQDTASDDELKLAAARDWAQFVQLRQAEKLMGEVARKAKASPASVAHQERLRETAIEAGLDPHMFAQIEGGPDLEKLHDLDDPTMRQMSTTLVDLLVETMDGAGMGLGGRKLLVSSLASGQVNALCGTNSWDADFYHVFVDSDLAVFCNAIAKIFAECLTIGEPVDGHVDLRVAAALAAGIPPEIEIHIAELYGAAVLKGTVRASKPWAPSPQALSIAVMMSDALMMFPLAHELAHLHLGHLASETTERIAVAGLDDFDAQVYSQSDEFNADMVGAVIASQTAIRLGTNNLFTLLAPYIFLKSVEVLDACFEIFDEKAGATNFTHPSATARARMMREVIRLHMAYHNSGTLLPVGLQIVDRISHWMLFTSILNLRKQKEAGVRPRERVKLRLAELNESPGIIGLMPSQGC